MFSLHNSWNCFLWCYIFFQTRIYLLDRQILKSFIFLQIRRTYITHQWTHICFQKINQNGFQVRPIYYQYKFYDILWKNFHIYNLISNIWAFSNFFNLPSISLSLLILWVYALPLTMRSHAHICENTRRQEVYWNSYSKGCPISSYCVTFKSILVFYNTGGLCIDWSVYLIPKMVSDRYKCAMYAVNIVQIWIYGWARPCLRSVRPKFCGLNLY